MPGPYWGLRPTGHHPQTPAAAALRTAINLGDFKPGNLGEKGLEANGTCAASTTYKHN